MARQLSRYARAGQMIRSFMREQGIVGSVRGQSYAGGSSINIHVEDMQPAALQALERFARQFEYGSFNGMEDIYEYNNVNDDLPQVSYVFVNNNISNGLRQAIWDFARGYYKGLENAPADAIEAGNYYCPNFDRYGQQVVYRLFAGGYMQNQYWDFVNGVEEEMMA